MIEIHKRNIDIIVYTYGVHSVCVCVCDRERERVCVCGLEREALFCMCEETVVEYMSRERERGAMGFVCVREREALSVLES